MTNRSLLAVSAILEAVTGLALVIAPAVVIQLLFGQEFSGAGLALGRFAGLGLFSFGVACWPAPASAVPALRAMLIYNSLAAVYLAYLRFAGDVGGALLIPASVIHALLAILLVWNWYKSRTAT